MRSQAESNAINRILKARGLGSLNDPDVVPALSRMVEDHQHFTEILRACEPMLRREMYEAMVPHLRFQAKTLEDYIIAAKEQAAAAELPVLERNGNLKPYMMPSIGKVAVVEVPDFELWLQCAKCGKESFFYAERKVDAIVGARDAGWAWDEYELCHMCPNCLDEVSGVALDKTAS